MSLKVNIDKLKQMVVLGMLFLASMNFQAKFFYFAFASLFFLMFFQRKIIINHISLIYVITCFLMAIYNHSEGILSMLRCFAYIALYLVGYNLIVFGSSKLSDLKKETSTERKGYVLLVTISSGAFSHYFLNFIINYNGTLGRNTNDIWTGQRMAATGQATLACLMLGLSIAMIFAPLQKKHRYYALVSLIIIFAYNLILAGRTLLVIMFLLFLVGFVYTWKNARYSNERLKMGLWILFASLMCVFAFTLNIGGIQGYLLNSNLFGRFGVSLDTFVLSSGRTISKVGFILNAWKYPFGGLYLREEFGYAHDLLLDGYDEYGLIGLLLLVLILISGLLELVKIIKSTTFGFEFKLSLLCIYSSILLVFCVEPILAGAQWLFCCYCLINGCITGMNSIFYRISRGN